MRCNMLGVREFVIAAGQPPAWTHVRSEGPGEVSGRSRTSPGGVCAQLQY